MSDLKISELLDGGSANLNDQIAVARTGVSYELTLGEVKVLILGTIATDVSNNALAITALQGDRLKLDGSNGPMTGNLSMGANKITSTYVPAADEDLVNRKYITDNYLPLAGGVMTGAITLHSTGTPGSGSEPVSYTFAEATYAKANGTDGFVARFSPNGTSFAESKIRDDGTTSSINGVVSATDQLKIYSSLNAALNIEASGTRGIEILSDFGSDSGFGVSSKVANGATVYALYGALPSTTGTITGNYYGVFATGTHTNAGQTIGGDIYGVYGNARHTAGTFGDGAGNGGDLYGVYGQASYSNTTNPMHSSERMAAIFGYSSVSSGATAVNGHGIRSQFDVDGTLTNGYAFYAGSSLSSGEITNYHAFYSKGCEATTCTVAYGLKLDAHTTGTTKWGVYQEGTLDENFFAGDTTIGQLKFDASQSVGSGQDDYVLTYSNSTGKISLESAAAPLTGSTNQVAYFTGTNVVGGDSDWLWDGSNMSLGEAIDNAVLANFKTTVEATTMQIENAKTSGDTYALKVANNASNSSDNHGVYIDTRNAGSGDSYGIFETSGAGAQNNEVRNYFASRVTIGRDRNWKDTSVMLSVDSYPNDVSAGDSHGGSYLDGYDEYNILRSINDGSSVTSGWKSIAHFTARSTSHAKEDFSYIMLTSGTVNSNTNYVGVIGVTGNSAGSNDQTDMFFGVRGDGLSDAGSGGQAHVQEAIRIKSGISGTFIGTPADTKIDAATVTPPRVQFGGSEGYTFPAEAPTGSAGQVMYTDSNGDIAWTTGGTSGQRLTTDGAGNLTWVTP